MRQSSFDVPFSDIRGRRAKTKNEEAGVKHNVKVSKYVFLISKKMKFGQSILRKIIKNVATICQILRLICNKIDFGWGSGLP